MAAEDWMDIYGAFEEENYFQQDPDPEDEPEKPQYTDKFTFNGRRLRTKFQKMIAKENKYIYGENW